MRAMLYGKYADGSIRAPRKDRPKLFENRDEVLAEHRKNIYRAFGKEYIPEEDSNDSENE